MSVREKASSQYKLSGWEGNKSMQTQLPKAILIKKTKNFEEIISPFIKIQESNKTQSLINACATTSRRKITTSPVKTGSPLMRRTRQNEVLDLNREPTLMDKLISKNKVAMDSLKTNSAYSPQSCPKQSSSPTRITATVIPSPPSRIKRMRGRPRGAVTASKCRTLFERPNRLKNNVNNNLVSSERNTKHKIINPEEAGKNKGVKIALESIRSKVKTRNRQNRNLRSASAKNDTTPTKLNPGKLRKSLPSRDNTLDFSKKVSNFISENRKSPLVKIAVVLPETKLHSALSLDNNVLRKSVGRPRGGGRGKVGVRSRGEGVARYLTRSDTMATLRNGKKRKLSLDELSNDRERKKRCIENGVKVEYGDLTLKNIEVDELNLKNIEDGTSLKSESEFSFDGLIDCLENSPKSISDISPSCKDKEGSHNVDTDSNVTNITTCTKNMTKVNPEMLSKTGNQQKKNEKSSRKDLLENFCSVKLNVSTMELLQLSQDLESDDSDSLFYSFRLDDDNYSADISEKNILGPQDDDFGNRRCTRSLTNRPLVTNGKEVNCEANDQLGRDVLNDRVKSIGDNNDISFDSSLVGDEHHCSSSVENLVSGSLVEDSRSGDSVEDRCFACASLVENERCVRSVEKLVGISGEAGCDSFVEDSRCDSAKDRGSASFVETEHCVSLVGDAGCDSLVQNNRNSDKNGESVCASLVENEHCASSVENVLRFSLMENAECARLVEDERFVNSVGNGESVCSKLVENEPFIGGEGCASFIELSRCRNSIADRGSLSLSNEQCGMAKEDARVHLVGDEGSVHLIGEEESGNVSMDGSSSIEDKGSDSLVLDEYCGNLSKDGVNSVRLGVSVHLVGDAGCSALSKDGDCISSTEDRQRCELEALNGDEDVNTSFSEHSSSFSFSLSFDEDENNTGEITSKSANQEKCLPTAEVCNSAEVNNLIEKMDAEEVSKEDCDLITTVPISSDSDEKQCPHKSIDKVDIIETESSKEEKSDILMSFVDSMNRNLCNISDVREKIVIVQPVNNYTVTQSEDVRCKETIMNHSDTGSMLTKENTNGLGRASIKKHFDTILTGLSSNDLALTVTPAHEETFGTTTSECSFLTLGARGQESNFDIDKLSDCPSSNSTETSEGEKTCSTNNVTPITFTINDSINNENLRDHSYSTAMMAGKTQIDEEASHKFPLSMNDSSVSPGCLKRQDQSLPCVNPEEAAIKESILSALGLQSLKAKSETVPLPDKSLKQPVSNYTGTLKAIIKLNRSSDKKGRKMFNKHSTSDGPGAGGDVLEYRICSEPGISMEGVPLTHLGDIAGNKYQPVRTQFDLSSSQNILSELPPAVDAAIVEGEKIDKDEKSGPDLVIPEKSASFSIHPHRLCSDVCSYCYGKFGSLDTPCHLAALKSSARQAKILAVKETAHLSLESCLCDACFRIVSKGNYPSQKLTDRRQKRRVGVAAGGNCSVVGCAEPACKSVRRKWLIKLKKSIAKKLVIDVEKSPHLPFPLCAQHYHWVDYFSACGLCKQRLTRNSMYAIGSEAPNLNTAMQEDGVLVHLSDKLFLCKLCRSYANMRLKCANPAQLSVNTRDFFKMYRNKLLNLHGVTVDKSVDEQVIGQEATAEIACKKRKNKKEASRERRKSCEDKSESRTWGEEGGPEGANDINVGFSNIADLLSPMAETKGTVYTDKRNERCIQVKFANLNIGKLSNLNIGQGSEGRVGDTSRPCYLPGERELPLCAQFDFPNDPGGSPAWERMTSVIQFDKETKKLWTELQRPYGNNSSFLRHLVMLEKYWRAGSLVLVEDADPRAAKYVASVRNRVQAYDGPPPPYTSTPPPYPSTPPPILQIPQGPKPISTMRPIHMVVGPSHHPSKSKVAKAKSQVDISQVPKVNYPTEFTVPAQGSESYAYEAVFAPFWRQQHLVKPKKADTVTKALQPLAVTTVAEDTKGNFVPIICDVRSLGPDDSPWDSKSESLLPIQERPVLPKIPKALTVTQIMASSRSPYSLLKTSSMTIEPSTTDVPKSVASERPSISVFREPTTSLPQNSYQGFQERAAPGEQ